MPTLRPIEMELIDQLFDMKGGTVLEFTNRTFADFFTHELGVDIYAERYGVEGPSKAKRLRCFLRGADEPSVVRTLNALWEYREVHREQSTKAETIPRARQRFEQIVERLGGKPNREASERADGFTSRHPSKALIDSLLAELLALPAMEPHPRGYAFERFLTRLFEAYGLDPREPFKLTGEQIDGSFQLASETYLMEAKWQALPVGAADLHSFHGKVEQKAAWARGLFVSNSGFSSDGLVAFGRGKRVVLMDGGDIYEVLKRNLSLSEVIEKKVRFAAETGVLFVRVRDLAPL
jgi:Restriction endonuclease